MQFEVEFQDHVENFPPLKCYWVTFQAIPTLDRLFYYHSEVHRNSVLLPALEIQMKEATFWTDFAFMQHFVH